MRTTWKLVVIGALAAAGGCKDRDAKQADRAAHHLVDNTERLRTAETRLDEREADNRMKVAEREDDVSRAADMFAQRRQTRIDALRAEREVIATQPPIIRTLIATLPLTDAGRADASEKVSVLELRIDETEHVIETLPAVPASEFSDRDDAATNAMSRLEDARKTAWTTVDNAPRIVKTSRR